MNIIEMHNITKRFINPKTKQQKLALNKVNFCLGHSEFVAIVGESGSGKSTLARVLMNLTSADTGDIKICGKKLNAYNNKQRHKLIQMVLQNPYAAFDPLQSINTSLSEVLICNSLAKNQSQAVSIIKENFKKYGLDDIDIGKKGSEFSGGQLQRLGILRAMLLKPKVLIADEVISALDNQLKITVLDMLKSLQLNDDLSIIFITHNIASIKQYADRIVVFKEGQIVECGTPYEILYNPKVSYTKKLIQSIVHLKNG